MTTIAKQQVIQEFLENDGWKEYNDMLSSSIRSWYKRFPEVVPNCAGNSDKPGIQICIRMYDYAQFQVAPDVLSFEMDVCSGCVDYAWCKLKFYGLAESDIFNKLDSFTTRLINAWKGANVGI